MHTLLVHMCKYVHVKMYFSFCVLVGSWHVPTKMMTYTELGQLLPILPFLDFSISSSHSQLAFSSESAVFVALLL